jgi:hypothetical protein
MEVRLVVLDGQDGVTPPVTIFAAPSFWQPIAAIVTKAPDRSSNSSRRGSAVISFDLSSTATWPKLTGWRRPRR